MSLLSRRLRHAATVTAAAALLCGGLTAVAVASYAVAVPAASVTLPVAIEAMPAYQPQTFCDPVDKPGPVAFGKLLTATYPDTTVVDISRSCTSESGTSEHKDGRALDWGARYDNAQQVKEVQTVFAWLFAKDAAGNPNAMLRRLGIMYIIWDKHIWGTWSQSWQPYACSGITACHQDHVHFSFDWAGARKTTSFWTGVVSPPVAPPTYVYTSASWPQIVSVSSRNAGVTTPFEVKAGLTYLFTVHGSYHYGKPTTALADAECSTRDAKTWSSLATGDTSTNSGLLDLWVDTHRAWRPLVSTGGGCNSSNHTYTRTLTFPATATVRLAISDSYRADNSGGLKVTVQRV